MAEFVVLRPVPRKTVGKVPQWFSEYQNAVDLWARDAQKAFEQLQQRSANQADRIKELEDASNTS